MGYKMWISFQELSPPQTLTEPMLSLFKKQESHRHALRCQHKVERERLILCCEKEVLRAHARDTRNTFLSAARVMKDSEVYNPLELEKVPSRLLHQSINHYTEISQ